MGLFSKSNKQPVIQTPSPVVITTAEKVICEQLKDDSDFHLTELARKLIDGCPLILDFEPLDIDPANKVMGFFSGVIFAIQGDISSVRDKIFLFTHKNAYDDGSLKDYLQQIF